MRLLDRLTTRRKRPSTGYTEQAGFVFILGMHRSGTSCLAGSLERCGLFLGDVVRRSPHNARGNHELRAALHVHNQILRASGGTWRQPPARVRLTWRQERALKAIAAPLVERAPSGLKDPRLLLLLDAWTELVDSYTMVGTFRHPAAVARSLARRNQISQAKACNLWLAYNGELIRWHRRHRFPIVEFDLSDVETYCRTVAAVATALGLKPDMDKLYEFVSPGLDHAPPAHEPVPATCQEMYAYLQHHRCQPVDVD